MSTEEIKEPASDTPGTPNPDAPEAAAVPKRTSYPAGWPAEFLDPLAPELGEAIEQTLSDMGTGGPRLRPVTVAADGQSVECHLLNEQSEPLAASNAAKLARRYTRHRGLRVIESDRGGGAFLVRIGTEYAEPEEPPAASEAAPASPPKSRRGGR